MNITKPSIKLSREGLLDALEARRPWAQRLDTRAIKTHETAEKRAHREFLSRVRDAAKWDYAAVVKSEFKVAVPYGQRPGSCPRSIEQRLDENIRIIKASEQKAYTVSNAGPLADVFWLLTYDERAKRDMCA